MELSVRSYLTAGIALTAASAIALTPVVVPTTPTTITLPHVSVSEMHLAAVISPADVAALVANLNAAMGSVSSTVTSLVDVSGQTLAGALNSAAGLNNNVWDGLIGAAGGSPMLAAVLVALKTASAGGLSQLATAVGSAGSAVTLSTGEVANLLTSTVTGSLGAALHAVAGIVNDPLSAASYIGLLTSPVGVIGLALQGGIDAAAGLATNGVGLASTLVKGVSAQIGNALSLVSGLLEAGKGLTDVALVDGALTAVQGIVSAPVTAALAGVNGLTSAAANAAVFTLGRVAGGASTAVGTWLGSGSTPGALQAAIGAIGSAPLSPASYTNAVSILVGAGVTTVETVIGTASSFASLPFRVAADLTGTAAEVINSFTNGMATAASGLLHAAGLPSFVSGLPYAVATAVTGAVNIAAFTTSAALNTISTVIDIGQAIGGALNLSAAAVTAKSAATADPAALPSTVTEHRNAVVTMATAPTPDTESDTSTVEDAAATGPASDTNPTDTPESTADTPPAESAAGADPETAAPAAEPSTSSTTTHPDTELVAGTGAPAAGAGAGEPEGKVTTPGTEAAQGSTDPSSDAENSRSDTSDTHEPTATAGTASSPAGGKHAARGSTVKPSTPAHPESAGDAQATGGTTSSTRGSGGGGRHARPDTAESSGSDTTSSASATSAAATSGGRHARPDAGESNGSTTPSATSSQAA